MDIRKIKVSFEYTNVEEYEINFDGERIDDEEILELVRQYKSNELSPEEFYWKISEVGCAIHDGNTTYAEFDIKITDWIDNCRKKGD